MSESLGLRPACCPLGERNLAWFPASPPAGAWHPTSFRWDPRVDVPVSAPVHACPFCGRPLEAPPGRGTLRSVAGDAR